jgi:hypothetical protein
VPDLQLPIGLNFHVSIVLLVGQFLRITLILTEGLTEAPLCRARKPLRSIRALRRMVLAKGDASGGIWCDRRLAVADSGQEHYSSNNPSVTVVGCHRHQRLLQYLFCRPFYRPFRHLLGRGRHRAPILVVLFTFFACRLVSNGRGLSLTLRLSRVPYAPTHRESCSFLSLNGGRDLWLLLYTLSQRLSISYAHQF